MCGSRVRPDQRRCPKCLAAHPKLLRAKRKTRLIFRRNLIIAASFLWFALFLFWMFTKLNHQSESAPTNLQ